jgi:hypothetical protein
LSYSLHPFWTSAKTGCRRSLGEPPRASTRVQLRSELISELAIASRGERGRS